MLTKKETDRLVELNAKRNKGEKLTEKETEEKALLESRKV